ncbi:MAG: GntG family PLP-dependent aldolase [Nitrospinota bacterium]|nr:GntG family PLP-dependent aldolase [Nitrospinota bacterium]
MTGKVVDLRADTFCRPTPGMREAMSQAGLGDDLFGENPTVNDLQDRAASLFDKEAALFVASGTMANQIAIKVYTQPGEEVICDARSHPIHSELAAAGMISGIQFRLLNGDRGIFSREDAEDAIRPDSPLFPRTALLWLENTHNQGGGQIFPLEKVEEFQALSLERRIPLHIDGARIFNAVVSSGVPPLEWGKRCDSLSFCLSKGLGCPMGSLLIGPKDFIARAARIRKMLGGGWRQAGTLAAAGIYALSHHIERLAEDHANAQTLAEHAAGVSGVRSTYETTPTNIVFLDVTESGRTGEEVTSRLRERGVSLFSVGKFSLRAVTHMDISREGVEQTIQALAEAVR